MRIAAVFPRTNWEIEIQTEEGAVGRFDVKPYLDFPVFEPLKSTSEFTRVRSGGYYVEWACGADLSSDTIEAKAVFEKSPTTGISI
jgi:hypothetical protein